MAFVVPSLYHGPNLCDACSFVKETGLHSWPAQANYHTPEEPAKGSGRLLVGLLGFRVSGLVTGSAHAHPQDYPADISMFKEMVQNADDAGATEASEHT